ncbi:hypothetical protein [Cryobacterium sp. PH31-L1]|uniref:hypothetical protein n=1 Tax=Cryobacterium sp. PH31-L1 TaxID=3046199 RepID=UPI0024BB4093|nr:hypothetical protein [Cryobacterium sp. PH31-L1]MDJ0377475.1 hypothetical protein [Cryobacterium sp. PH31-L1]
MDKSQILALADDRRLRDLRRGGLLVFLGVLIFAGAWLLIPFGIFQSAAGSAWFVVGGVVLLADSAWLVVIGTRMRRRAQRDHAVATAFGKANPAFDEDRKPVPTAGVPLGWIGNVP